MFDYARLKSDVLALVILAAIVFVGLALATYDPADPPSSQSFPPRAVAQNLAGSVGAATAAALVRLLGVGSWFLLAALIVWDYRLFTRGVMARPGAALAGFVLLQLAVCTALQWQWPLAWTLSNAGAGGRCGAWGLILLLRYFEPVGVAALLVSAAAAGLLLCGEWRLIGSLGRLLALPVTMWGDLAFPNFEADASRRASRSKAMPVPVAAATSVEPPATVAATATAGTDAAVSDGPIAPAVEGAVQPGAVAAMLRLVGAGRRKAVAKTVAGQGPVTAEGVPATVPFPKLAAGEPTDDGPVRLRLVAEEPAATKPVEKLASDSAPRGPIRVNPPVGSNKSAAVPAKAELVPAAEFRLPTLDLLADAEEFPYEQLAERAQVAAQTLERTFQEFGLNVKVVEIDTGPVITQFELDLEAGLRLSKVSALADDLAIALRVPSVRVVPSIPGKNTVGAEVPNNLRVMVRMKELLEASQADLTSKRIPLFFGKDVSGRPLVVDLCKLPHLLIAGRTGTGKSVCLNTLILSILLTRTPEQVKLLMIDPKMVELSPYMRIPHLMHPVITDMKKAEAVLGWAVDKMEERYDLLARVGVRHLDNYNQLGKAAVLDRLDIDPDSDEAEAIPEHMPYIVIIADEMADMMMTSGKDVEGHIIRLAQKSRAVGIHLVLATQKPTVDVITGLIKSNLPARISFQVASKSDSRVVLDEGGADKLLGNGDMLYLAPGTSHLTRAQGTYVSDDEVNAIIEFYSDREPQYSAEITQVTNAAGRAAKNAGEPKDRDELYEQAVEVIIREGRGSVSLLQRALGVGYGRGARLIDMMSDDGIVGTYNGSQAREVLMTLDQWEELRSTRGEYAEA